MIQNINRKQIIQITSILLLLLVHICTFSQIVIKVDSTFNVIGYHTIDLSPSAYANQAGIFMRINPVDGKYIVRGIVGPQLAYLKYKQNGSFDSSFNSVGFLVQPNSEGATGRFYFDDQQRLINGLDLTDGSNRMAFMRTKQNGWPDSSFGSNGTLIVSNSNDKGGALFKLADGTYMTERVFDNDPGPTYLFGLSFTKYNSDYSINTSFGTNGTIKHFFNYPFDFGPSGIQFYSDGRFLVGATTRTLPYDPNYGYDNNATFFRFLPDGSLDPSFGVNGIAQLYFGDHLQEGLGQTIVTPAGDIYAFGFSGRFIGADPRGLVVKLLPNGNIDSSFGIFGRYICPQLFEINAAVIQKDGKFLISGDPGYNIARLTADGFEDLQFGVNGTFWSPYTLPVGGFPYSMLSENDTTLLLTGNAFSSNQSNNVTTARYKLTFQPYVTGIRSRYCQGSTATGTIINMPAPDTTVTVLLDNVPISVSGAGVFSFATGTVGQHIVEVRFSKGTGLWREIIRYTVLANVAPVITTPDQKICKDGSIVDILADGPVYWAGNGVPVSLISSNSVIFYPTGLSGSQQVIAIRDNGPCGIRRDTVTFQLIQLSPLITANGNILSTALTQGATYRWYLNGVPISGATTNQYTATQGGTYIVSEGLINCTKFSAQFVVSITAVGNPGTNTSFSIFPNPAGSEIYLKGLKQNRRYEYSIISNDGRIILSDLTLSFPFRINTESLPSGVYYIEIREKGTYRSSINCKLTLIR